VFKKTGIGENGVVLGEFLPTGIRSRFTERLLSSGVKLPADIFDPTRTH